MACFHPITAYRDSSGGVIFDVKKAVGASFQLPCGRCNGCRLERSKQWAIRCMHEASLWKHNCFITLTYDSLKVKDISQTQTLNVEDFQLFMKRLRKRFSGCDVITDYEKGKLIRPIRFFHCGEYGEQLQRPHHHACIFNFDFPDKYLYKVNYYGKSKNGRSEMLYRSPALEELWPYGFSAIGDVTFDSAAYCARYIMKKVNGPLSELHYSGCKPEYITMSRNPGVAKWWFDKYKNDVYPSDNVVLRNGKICKPPRYYDKLYDLTNPDDFVNIKIKREELAFEREHENTKERLQVRETIASKRLDKLIRPLH